ncbi:MAG TPA: DUF2298 domain-containing protein [Bellilinea sp.]|nr:DUF2298 domain-containing protein [Bellilinea sp.]
MIDVVWWYLVVSIAGWLTLPLAQRLLRFLPDRGFTLVRPLALLGWGFIFWLLTSLGVLQNDIGGVLLALVLLAIISLIAGNRRLGELWNWIKQHKRVVITSEVLFLLAFAAWAFVRAANPDVNYTEKPMELAFINSILRSPGFPPNDPWLSGYAISYYYFGYVIVAMLVHVTGTVSSVAFNLAIAMWFALTALGAYGIVYNLLARSGDVQDEAQPRRAAGWALLAPLFILIVSNLSGLLDVLHANGVFWSAGSDGQLQSPFWTWLNIKELNVAPREPLGWLPQRGGWLWWMGSRVVQDFTLSGGTTEVINEFPFFSYLLADLHPHVLAMPFVLLAVGLALNLAYRGLGEKIEKVQVSSRLRNFEFWSTAIILGGLSFLNTWDFPIYVALFAAVFTWHRTVQNGWGWARVGDFIKIGLLFGIAGAVVYLPFYIGFASQAGGLLPSLAFHTRGAYFLVMFLPLLFPISTWLIANLRKVSRRDWRNGLLAGVGVVTALWVFMLAAGVLFQAALTAGQSWQANGGTLAATGARLSSAVSAFFGTQGGGGAELLQTAVLRRITDPVTWLILLVVVIFAWVVLSAARRQPLTAEINPEDQPPPLAPHRVINAFVALLILIGAGLTLLPEFFYLKDGFGTRLNTIFKFYFQTWMVWGLAAAYSTAILWRQLRKLGAAAFKAGWVLLTAAALIYPVIMLTAKTGLPGKPLTELTLDGKAYLQRYNPDEWAAFTWLQSAPIGVVAETVGASYNPDTARVSTHSGQPSLLGWEGHEWQWRGGAEEIGSRRGDLDVLFTTNNWEEASIITTRYAIRYIYVGPVERATYNVDETKFLDNTRVVYQNAAVTIYEVPGENPQSLLISEQVTP